MQPTMRRNKRMSMTRDQMYDSIMNQQDEEQFISNPLDDNSISVELEQGKSAGRVNGSMLKKSAPIVHCAYMGQAARHINVVGEDYILVVNSEHKVDVYKRGDPKNVKTLDIDYMRYSLVVGSLLFIGTEEKLLYMLDALTFEVIDKIQTQSFIFTLCAMDEDTVIAGQYQGHVDVIRVKTHSSLHKIYKGKILTGNIYKIIKTDIPNEFAFGCGNGLYFANWQDDCFEVLNE